MVWLPGVDQHDTLGAAQTADLQQLLMQEQLWPVTDEFSVCIAKWHAMLLMLPLMQQMPQLANTGPTRALYASVARVFQALEGHKQNLVSIRLHELPVATSSTGKQSVCVGKGLVELLASKLKSLVGLQESIGHCVCQGS